MSSSSHSSGLPVLDADAFLKAAMKAPRPGADKVLAFYDHRVGAVCNDARAMMIPLDDHLVHRGDGVFETLKYIDGRIYQLQPHITRMQGSAAAIYLEPPCPWDELADLVVNVARLSGKTTGLLRILLGRGPGGFGIDPAECPTPSLYIAAYGFSPKPESFFETGASACRTSIPAKQSYMARIKSIDYLPNMLMKREASERGCDYPLCFDDHGFLAEGATENICMVDPGGVLVVPEFTNALKGTTLMRGLELIGGEITLETRPITEDELYVARELIVVGTTVDAVGVVRFNGKPVHDVRPGPVARRLRELLKADLAENGAPL